MSARDCGGSSSSLPGTPGGDVNHANSVLSWAVSFEKLLEDPHGVGYFTVRRTRYYLDNNILAVCLLVCYEHTFTKQSVFIHASLQAFLKSEVSAENILFWQECEKFRKIPATSLDQVFCHILII